MYLRLLLRCILLPCWLTVVLAAHVRINAAISTYFYACKYVFIYECIYVYMRICVYELLALLAVSLLCYFCFAALTLGLFALLASLPFGFNCWLVACWRLYEYYCLCFLLLAQSQMLKWPGRLLSLLGAVQCCVPRAYILAHIYSQSIEPRTITFL